MSGGIVNSGSSIEILSRDELKVSVPDITRLYISHERDAELLTGQRHRARSETDRRGQRILCHLGQLLAGGLRLDILSLGIGVIL